VVEVNLTSTDLILGVRGKDHPLPAYLAAGVPVVLSSDDAGISRIDLTNEYMRAARDYGLGYRMLKAIARNSLIHSFLAARHNALRGCACRPPLPAEGQGGPHLARSARSGRKGARRGGRRQPPLKNARPFQRPGRPPPP